MVFCLASIAGAGIRPLGFRANKARRPFGLASLRLVGGKRQVIVPHIPPGMKTAVPRCKPRLMAQGLALAIFDIVNGF